MKNLLFIDTSYTYGQIYKRNSLNIIYARDLNKYFNKVISVHPTANLTDRNINKLNSFYKITHINNRHIFLEFKSSILNNYFFLKHMSFIYLQGKMILKLIKIINEEKITEIKCGDINYSGLLGLILSFITGIKFYVRVGSNNDKIREEINTAIQKKLFIFKAVEKFFEKTILNRASHIFPANNDNSNFVSRYVNDKSKLTVIRYGPLINDCHYIPSNERKIIDIELKNYKKNYSKIIVCIARFEKVKKVDDVIHLFKRLLEHDNKLILFLVGDGSLKDEYITLSKKLKISDKIIFTGDKNQNWISELLSITDLILSPHTGRALCEAALAGCNIVGYDIDWQSEIITHNQSGFFSKIRR